MGIRIRTKNTKTLNWRLMPYGMYMQLFKLDLDLPINCNVLMSYLHPLKAL